MRKLTELVAWVAVCLTVVQGEGVPLQSWRSAWAPALSELGLLRSSPSGLFWDLLDCADPGLAAALAWPDSQQCAVDHWRLEPSLRGFADSRPYVDQRSVAGRFEVSNDIHYRRLFARQRLEVDSRWKGDSLYAWKTDRAAAGRIQEAWVQAKFDHAFVRFGRMRRCWGPLVDQSLVLSAAPYTFDALEWQVWGTFFEFRHLFAALDFGTSNLDTDSSKVQRYITAHALNLVLGDWVSVGVFESVVFAREGMPDWQYVNPVGIYTVTNTNQEGAGNLMLGVQWRVHPFTKSLELLGQVLLDDIQVDNEDIGDQEPSHWGLDAAVYWRNPLPWRLRHAFRLRYTYLSRWLYLVSQSNTVDGERYTYLGEGIGVPVNDGDRWEAGFSAVSGKGWFARAGVVYGRNGGNTLVTPWNSGDTANPGAGYNGYRTETSLRSDTAEHSIEAYAEGRFAWRGIVDVGMCGAVRWVKNRDNTESDKFEFAPWIAGDVAVQYPFFKMVFGARRGRRRHERGAADTECGG